MHFCQMHFSSDVKLVSVFQIFRRIQLQAGFIELLQLKFQEAKELFMEGGLDVREVRGTVRGLSLSGY